MKNARNTGIEVLRFICLFGIILMHSFGPHIDTCSGLLRIYGVTINSLFNAGVSIFMLISGYYGIDASIKKWIKIEGMLIFYSVLSFAVNYYFSSAISLKEIAQAVLPIITNSYWYFTAYFIIFVFSSNLNKVSEQLGKRGLLSLIILMLGCFYFIPTFLYFDLTGDSGKGVLNLLTVYLVGRYLRLYYEPKKSSGFYCLCGLAFSTISGILNYICSFIRYGDKGLFAPFGRDNSLFILCSAICFFIASLKWNIQSHGFNSVTKLALSAFVFEYPAKKIVGSCFWFTGEYTYLPYPIIAMINALFVLLLCLLIEFVRINTIGKIEQPISALVERIACQINKLVNRCINDLK